MKQIALRTRFALIAICCMLASAVVRGQEPGSKPETLAPAPAQATPATAPATATPAPVDDYWKKHDELLRVDFGWLAKFKEAL